MLVEVELSAAQFAGLLTTMNIGHGVPCTIRQVQGESRLSERKALLYRLEMLEQEIRSNIPFMLKQFEEATTKVVTAAKAEVDAFITYTATKLGIERLREMSTSPSLDPASDLLCLPGEE